MQFGTQVFPDFFCRHHVPPHSDSLNDLMILNVHFFCSKCWNLYNLYILDYFGTSIPFLIFMSFCLLWSTPMSNTLSWVTFPPRRQQWLVDGRKWSEEVRQQVLRLLAGAEQPLLDGQRVYLPSPTWGCPKTIKNPPSEPWCYGIFTYICRGDILGKCW